MRYTAKSLRKSGRKVKSLTDAYGNKIDFNDVTELDTATGKVIRHERNQFGCFMQFNNTMLTTETWYSAPLTIDIEP